MAAGSAGISEVEILGAEDWTVLVDVRPEYGSCSALIAEYWNDAGLIPPTNVATALLYGIRSDTDGLSRGVHLHDIESYFQLYGHADMSKITEKVTLSTAGAEPPPHLFLKIPALYQS